MKKIRVEFLFMISFSLLLGTCAQKSEDGRPNIILFVVDDLGWTDLGYKGNTYNLTPNIDRIAREGTIFTNAYANAPNCAPTRACLLSGQYTPRHGVFTVGSPQRGESIYRKLIPPHNNTQLSKDNLTFAELLQNNGYVTAHFGKWHLGDGPTGPLQRGFDYNYGGNQAGHPKSYFSPYGNKDLPDGPEGEYLTDRLGQEVIKFIETHKDSTFLIYFPFYNVHTPIQGKPELIKNFDDKNCERIKCNATYAAMIQSVDIAIGNIFNALVETGLSQKTVILFTSDNGPYFPVSTAEPLRGSKGMLYEGGIRVPAFIWHPDYNGKISTSDEPIISIDFFPTLLDIAKIPVPDDKLLDGKSLLPIISGEFFSREQLFWHFPAYLERYPGVKHIWRTTPAGAMRKGPWKIIEFFESNKVELYNLDDDISEAKDLSQDYPNILNEMISDLHAWRKTTNAPFPTELNPAYNQKLFDQKLDEIIAGNSD